jgi:hypothetical protein
VSVDRHWSNLELELDLEGVASVRLSFSKGGLGLRHPPKQPTGIRSEEPLPEIQRAVNVSFKKKGVVITGSCVTVSVEFRTRANRKIWGVSIKARVQQN